ncbi:hypothetical protein BC629DRAFT_1437425 [Irpex lacteus]|nr:hypothetical protein BC629DRAFT_1437425 [Irpex lacteus]
MSNSQMDGMDASELQQFTTTMQLILASTGEEVDYFWAPEWTLATWIFVSSRYATLVSMALQLLPAPNYTLYIEYLARERQYSDSDRHIGVTRIPLAIVVLVLAAVVPGALNMMLFFRESVVFQLASPDNACVRLSVTVAQILTDAYGTSPVSLLSRVSVTVADAIALTVAWRKAAGSSLKWSIGTSRKTMLEVLTREGTAVFLGLIMLNVFGILQDNIVTDASTFLVPLSTIIVCRFMLSMRQTSDRYRTNDTTFNGRHTTQFNSTVITGDLGESSELENIGNASGEDPDDQSNGALSTGTEGGNSV